MLLKRLPRSSKPTHEVGIDWSHPLARGLVFAIFPGTGGVLPRDLVSNKVPTLSAGTNITQGVSDGTKNAYSDGTNVLDYGRTGADELTTTGTMVTRLRNTAQPSNDVIMQSGESAFGYGYRMAIDDTIAVNNGFIAATDNGGNSTMFASDYDILPDPCEDFWHTLAVDWDGTNENGYVGGVFHKQTSNAAAPTAHANRTTTVLGTRTDDPTITGYLSWFLIWDRPLTAREHKQIADNPYQILQSQATILGMKLDSTVAPLAANHLIRMNNG